MANPNPYGTPAWYEYEAQNPTQSSGPVAAPYDPAATAAILQAQQSVDPNAVPANPSAPAAPKHFVSAAAAPPAQPGEMRYTPREPTAPAAPPPPPPGTDPSKLVNLAGARGAAQQPQGLPMPGVIPGGGGPVKVIPGGRTPQSWQVTQETGQQFSPELLGNIDRANQDARRALELEQSAQKDAADAQSIVDEKRVVFDAQEKQKRAAEEAARLDHERSLKARVDSLRDINPSAAWENTSGFGKAMTMIAAALAGAAAGLRGDSHNPVLEALQKEAEQDTRLQLKKLDDASGELKDFYAQYPTFQAKLAAGTALRLEDMQRQNESLFAGAKNQLAAAQGLKMASALQEKQNELRAKMEKEAQGKEVVARHDVMTKAQVVGGGGGPRLDPTATLVALRKMGGEEAVEKFKKDVDAAASMYKGDPRAHDRALIAMSAAWGVSPGQLTEKEGNQAASYGERMEKSGAPRIADLAGQFRQMAEQAAPGERVPGFRWVDKITPEVLMGDQAYANEARVANARMMLGQIVSGSSVSASQEAAINRIAGGRGTREDFETAATILEQEARARDRAASAGIAPRAIENARKNYGDLTNKVLNTRAPGEK